MRRSDKGREQDAVSFSTLFAVMLKPTPNLMEHFTTIEPIQITHFQPIYATGLSPARSSLYA
jgi:hypothetical protein